MNSIGSHRRLRFVIAGAATLMTAAALASAALAGLGALDLGPAAASQYPGKKVAVCHRTHSKKHPWVKISISTHALKAHLRHGDFVVDANHPCPPTSAASAASKHSGKAKGKGKKGKNSVVGKKGKNSAVGKKGKNSAVVVGKKGKNSTVVVGKKGKNGDVGKKGKNNAAPKKNQDHADNKGGNGQGKK
jgi:hypothetical protein